MRLCSRMCMQICSSESCVCSGIPERNWLAVTPHDKYFNIWTARTSREIDSGDNGDISSQDSVSLPHTLAGLNYAITA